jgi:pyruvate dehydrogenase E2 component (dihydrolipoamide acetyltransferase)
MAIEIKVPRLGWNMEQGTFLGWLARDGAEIKAGQPLFTLEGDKAVQEIEATDAGVLHIADDGPKENDIVLVGKVLGHLAAPGEAIVAAPVAEVAASPSVRRLAREMGVDLTRIQGSASGRITEADLRASRQATVAGVEDPGKRHSPHPQERSEGSPAGVSDPSHRKAITPRARRAAAKQGIDWKQVTGTGRDGRIRERDIVGQAPRQAGTTNTRRVIAERMVHSLRNTAPVTLTTTADATNLVNLRQQFRAMAGTILPTTTDFIVKLTALALQEHPALNARWEDAGIVSSPEVHIGVAVDTEAGLLVPVIRNVERLTMRQLAAQSMELLERTRARRLTADEMQGGTCTVSNLGAFGIDAFTPIINWPQCAILGVGRITKQPVVVEGQIVARDQVTLSLTFDHRIVDGAPAARFLQALVRGIENPAAWLMG